MKNLIIGQGIAGTTLAHRLISEKEEVFIVDNSHHRASSMVAAGLWNPIVFRRMNKSWMADEFLNEMEAFYPKVEARIAHAFYHKKDLYRMYGSKEEANLWLEKHDSESFKQYLKPEMDFEMDAFHSAPFGSGMVQGAGYVNLSNYLKGSKSYFESKGIYVADELEWPTELEQIEQIQFKGQTMDRIIDCRGEQASNATCWNFLPFNLTKGEVLSIHAPGIKLEEIFNAGFFILPLGDDKFRVGATFDWKNLDYQATDKGRETLVAKLRKWTDIPFTIVDHQAGIRPTVKDRRPLLGKHPGSEKLFIFNGLGAKGVMQAPYLSQLFVGFLKHNAQLPSEIGISRFL